MNANDALDTLLETPEDPREALGRAERALQNAKLRLERELPWPARPTGEVSWPEDLTLSDPETLGRTLGALAGWLAYAESELARCETQTLLLEYQRELERALFEGKKAEWEASAAARRLGVALLEWQSKARLLKGLIKGYEARYAAISRELTRRGVASQTGRGA